MIRWLASTNVDVITNGDKGWWWSFICGQHTMPTYFRDTISNIPSWKEGYHIPCLFGGTSKPWTSWRFQNHHSAGASMLRRWSWCSPLWYGKTWRGTCRACYHQQSMYGLQWKVDAQSSPTLNLAIRTCQRDRRRLIGVFLCIGKPGSNCRHKWQTSVQYWR